MTLVPLYMRGGGTTVYVPSERLVTGTFSIDNELKIPLEVRFDVAAGSEQLFEMLPTSLNQENIDTCQFSFKLKPNADVCPNDDGMPVTFPIPITVQLFRLGSKRLFSTKNFEIMCNSPPEGRLLWDDTERVLNVIVPNKHVIDTQYITLNVSGTVIENGRPVEKTEPWTVEIIEFSGSVSDVESSISLEPSRFLGRVKNDESPLGGTQNQLAGPRGDVIIKGFTLTDAFGVKTAYNDETNIGEISGKIGIQKIKLNYNTSSIDIDVPTKPNNQDPNNYINNLSSSIHTTTTLTDVDASTKITLTITPKASDKWVYYSANAPQKIGDSVNGVVNITPSTDSNGSITVEFYLVQNWTAGCVRLQVTPENGDWATHDFVFKPASTP
ncbi:MAG: hypothetical protein IJR50_04780 [Treponema sp.]|nr:hypothetical protein [Treponema sp.]